MPAFTVPPELAADAPPEARGVPRDGVRLLVARPGRPLRHLTFAGLPGVLRRGDLLVVNDSDTEPAAVDGHRADGRPVVLHVSGPALSKQIRKLESELGLTLLDRGSHPVRLTGEGEEFAAAAREVLAAADHAVAVAAAARRRLTGALTIGFVLGFAGHLTRPILDGLAGQDPGISVELVELGFGEQVAAVWQGRVDERF